MRVDAVKENNSAAKKSDIRETGMSPGDKRPMTG
jgi:hypothetical protein